MHELLGGEKRAFLQKCIWKIFSNWISLRLYFLMAFDHAITARAISNRGTSESHSQQIWDITFNHYKQKFVATFYFKCQGPIIRNIPSPTALIETGL